MSAVSQEDLFHDSEDYDPAFPTDTQDWGTVTPRVGEPCNGNGDMSATTFELLTKWTRQRPGESSSSDEAGLTPTPSVYIETPLHVLYHLLNDETNCQILLDGMNRYQRLIFPSTLLRFRKHHYFLVWQPCHSHPIFVQLLVQEQVRAMRAGLISDCPASTWTGNRWVNDGAFLSHWGHGHRFTKSHLNDYRITLERATLELCKLLSMEYTPRRTMLHFQQIRRLEASGATDASERIKLLRSEYNRVTRRSKNALGHERRKAMSGLAEHERGRPLNEQRLLTNSQGDSNPQHDRYSLKVELSSDCTSHLRIMATTVDTPDNPMTQTPGPGPGVGAAGMSRTHCAPSSPTTSLASLDGRHQVHTPSMATDQTPGPGPGVGDDGQSRAHLTPLLPTAGRKQQRRHGNSALTEDLYSSLRKQCMNPSTWAVAQTQGLGPGGGANDQDGHHARFLQTANYLSRNPIGQLDTESDDCLGTSVATADQTPGPGPGVGTNVSHEPRESQRRPEVQSMEKTRSHNLTSLDLDFRTRQPLQWQHRVPRGTTGPAQDSLSPLDNLRRNAAPKRRLTPLTVAATDARQTASQPSPITDVGDINALRVQLAANCPRRLRIIASGTTALVDTSVPTSEINSVVNSVADPREGTLPRDPPRTCDSQPHSQEPEKGAALLDTDEMVDYDYNWASDEERAKQRVASLHDRQISAPPSPQSTVPKQRPPALEEDGSSWSQERMGAALTVVDLALTDKLPWHPTGTLNLSIRDINHDTHYLQLRTTSSKAGEWRESMEAYTEHEAAIDALLRANPASGLYILAPVSERSNTSTVMVSLANQTGIIALCVLRSVAKERYTRSSPFWDLSLLFTAVTLRGKGFGSALLRIAMSQAMLIQPGTIISRTNLSISDMLTHAGFEQHGPSFNWAYNHCPRMPQPPLLDPTRTPPVSIITSARFCYILSTLQVIQGQPGLLGWMLQQKWPHFGVGYSVAMLLAKETLPQSDQPSCESLLASLYLTLVRRNKCMKGHSPHGPEDQDAFDLMLALLDCLDRELGPSTPAPIFRVARADTSVCSNVTCSESLTHQVHDRALRVPFSDHSAPCRLESLLALHAEPEQRRSTCASCHHTERRYETAITDISQDVAIHFPREQYLDGQACLSTTEILLPTQFRLKLQDSGPLLRLKTVLLLGQWKDTRGNLERHWLVITHRHLAAGTHRRETTTWFLADDHVLTNLGEIGPYEDNCTLCLNHTALRQYETLVVCGAFYSRYDPEPSLSWISIGTYSRHATPILDAAIRSLQSVGVTTARCPWYQYTSAENLHSLVNRSLQARSAITLKIPYLRESLVPLDLNLRQSEVRLTKENGSRSKVIPFRDSLSHAYEGWGHAEAILGGLGSSQLGGTGLTFAHDLGAQLGVKLFEPSGIVLTCSPYVTAFHHHTLPVINSGVAIGSRDPDRAPWQTVGLYEPRVVKGYIFTQVATLELLGVNVSESGSLSLDTLVNRIARLSPASKEALLFEWAVMDGHETTHVIFPDGILHYVTTESTNGRSEAVYCGIGSYFFPNDAATANSLRDSIQSSGHSSHLARQVPSQEEALRMLDAHILGLDTLAIAAPHAHLETATPSEPTSAPCLTRSGTAPGHARPPDVSHA
jgi:hypothetical protein